MDTSQAPLSSHAMQFFRNSLDATHSHAATQTLRRVPVWRLVEDPLDAIHKVVSDVFEAPTAAGRRVRNKLRRIAGWGVDRDGNSVFYGKTCCATFIRSQDDRYLRLGSVLRAPASAADTGVCTECLAPRVSVGATCACGGVSRRNDEHTCPECQSVYRLEFEDQYR